MFWRRDELINEYVLKAFPKNFFPAGGYIIPDPNKTATYYVEGHNNYFYMFTKQASGEKCDKIPGDKHGGVFHPGSLVLGTDSVCSILALCTQYSTVPVGEHVYIVHIRDTPYDMCRA